MRRIKDIEIKKKKKKNGLDINDLIVEDDAEGDGKNGKKEEQTGQKTKREQDKRRNKKKENDEKKYEAFTTRIEC